MNPQHLHVLVIDPNENSGTAATRELERIGYPVTQVVTLKRAIRLMARRDYDLIIVSLGVAGLGVRPLLERIRAAAPGAGILVLADHAEVERAIRAIKHGAEDYLIRPLDAYELRRRVGRMLERRDLSSRLADLQTVLTRRYGLQSIVQQSPAMRGVVQRVAQVAPTNSSVLILGESGVGKELIAKAIHYNSPRRERPFLAINCSAIPQNLIESELFGHERGAFTGAVERVKGKFEAAHSGTIFLDEVAEMDLQTQVRLLRVLEEREVMRVGGHRPIRVDVRLIAATNADLPARIRQGRFREDLYFRLKVITVRVPPLRERSADLPDLVRLFLDSLCRLNQLPAKEVSPEALFLMQNYSWPGNVRELKNLLESLAITGPRDRIAADDLPPPLRGEKSPEEIVPRVEAGMTLKDVERDLIRKTLLRTEGNRTRAARILQIGVRTLQRKIREYELP